MKPQAMGATIAATTNMRPHVLNFITIALT
jgi:hypothetical protein